MIKKQILTGLVALVSLAGCSQDANESNVETRIEKKYDMQSFFQEKGWKHGIYECATGSGKGPIYIFNSKNPEGKAIEGYNPYPYVGFEVFDLKSHKPNVRILVSANAMDENAYQCRYITPSKITNL